MTEWALVTAFLAVAAAGAIAIFGDDIRAALGIAPVDPTAPAKGTGSGARAGGSPPRGR